MYIYCAFIVLLLCTYLSQLHVCYVCVRVCVCVCVYFTKTNIHNTYAYMYIYCAFIVLLLCKYLSQLHVCYVCVCVYFTKRNIHIHICIHIHLLRFYSPLAGQILDPAACMLYVCVCVCVCVYFTKPNIHIHICIHMHTYAYMYTYAHICIQMFKKMQY